MEVADGENLADVRLPRVAAAVSGIVHRLALVVRHLGDSYYKGVIFMRKYYLAAVFAVLWSGVLFGNVGVFRGSGQCRRQPQKNRCDDEFLHFSPSGSVESNINNYHTRRGEYGAAARRPRSARFPQNRLKPEGRGGSNAAEGDLVE